MMALFTHLGWIWCLTAAGTTAVAFALAAWCTWRPAATPHAQHRLAVYALLACLAILALAPLALIRDAGQRPPASPEPRTSQPLPAAVKTPVDALPQPIGASPQTANAIARAVGALWMLGVAFMLTRLAGGWLVVHQLAVRARLSDSPLVRDVVDRLETMMSVRRPVRVCESAEVDVPIIVGCAPVLIVPPHLASESSTGLLEPLLAHELAHVVRRDYLVNMLQSVADAVMCAFPGARWISARIRETREYCCDEIALQVCGDRRRYVEALAGIAKFSLARQPVAALGVGGPPLAARIRRLLHGNPEVRHRRPRLIALVVLAALLIVVADRAAGLAAAQVAQLQTGQGSNPVARSGHSFEVSMSYLFDQPGSAVALTRAVAGANFACDSARARNNANVAVTGLAFVAVVTLDAGANPVQIYSTDLIPVDLAAGSEADVDVHLLPQADWGRLGAISPRVQVMCALTRVTYANGAVWEVTPNPAARTADAALSLPPAEVSRSRFSEAATPGTECRDDRGALYSRGAVVPIRNEPGTLAQCLDASPPGKREQVVRWVEYRPGLRK